MGVRKTPSPGSCGRGCASRGEAGGRKSPSPGSWEKWEDREGLDQALDTEGCGWVPSAVGGHSLHCPVYGKHPSRAGMALSWEGREESRLAPGGPCTREPAGSVGAQTRQSLPGPPCGRPDATPGCKRPQQAARK